MGSAAAGLLGAITQIGSGTASDADILFEYIRSQKIVEEIDAELDLRTIYNKAGYDRGTGDPVSPSAPTARSRRWCAIGPDGRGQLRFQRRHHRRARQRLHAEDAQAIAAAILARSSALVNRLSEQAREDAVRFAREELAEAEAQLTVVRQRMADFRRENRIVDPSADAAGQMGLLNALQAELAQALVDRDVLLSYADPGDQRVLQANRRITAITERIEDERASLGMVGATSTLPEVIGAYEELVVDLEFANAAYTQTLAGLAAARAEARRQSRYLAPTCSRPGRKARLPPPRAPRRAYRPVPVPGLGILMLVAYKCATASRG